MRSPQKFVKGAKVQKACNKGLRFSASGLGLHSMRLPDVLHCLSF